MVYEANVPMISKGFAVLKLFLSHAWLGKCDCVSLANFQQRKRNPILVETTSPFTTVICPRRTD
jgi:hypothetical protein